MVEDCGRMELLFVEGVGGEKSPQDTKLDKGETDSVPMHHNNEERSCRCKGDRVSASIL